MSPTFKSNVKNENLRKCRIVAELFFKTSIREFFRVFRQIAQLGWAEVSGRLVDSVDVFV